MGYGLEGGIVGWEPQWLAALIAALLVAEAMMDAGLNRLNARLVRENAQLPDFFLGRISAEAYTRSRDYTLDKLRFDSFSTLFSAALVLVILFSGLLPSLDALSTSLAPGPLTRGVIFLGLLFLLQSALKLPLSLWSVFSIEGKHGFNTQTPGGFFSDLGKELLLGMVLGIPFLYALLWFPMRAGALWWLWLLVFITVFQAVLMLAYPTFIAPLFNKFKPLDEGPLREELLDLARKVEFSARDVMVMDGSRRSTHSNAYFTGFGGARRIVLFDTLIAQLGVQELKAVLAHEIGHWKRRHIPKMLVSQLLFMAAALYLLSLLLQWEPLFSAFGFAEPALHAGFYFFLVLLSPISFLLSPLRNRLSRRYEYEADAFAAEALGDKGPMEDALFRISEKNLSNLTPHPWYSAVHYSHPTLHERVRALRGI